MRGRASGQRFLPRGLRGPPDGPARARPGLGRGGRRLVRALALRPARLARSLHPRRQLRRLDSIKYATLIYLFFLLD